MLAEILAGADETVRAAGALLAGGHTIRDNEPKYGLAVVGTAHPDAIWAKSNAAPGDARLPHEAARHGARPARAKRELAGEAELAEAVRWMRMLNRDAADALRPFQPNAVTDVTGFGLLGHAWETAVAERRADRARRATVLPALSGALEVARAGEVTGGDRRNREFAGEHVDVAEGVPRTSSRWPGTRRPSGGLLISPAQGPRRRAAGVVRRRRALPRADRHG